MITSPTETNQYMADSMDGDGRNVKTKVVSALGWGGGWWGREGEGDC